MELRSDERPAEISTPFYTRYGLTRTGRRDAPLELVPYPEICRGGRLRATIAAAVIDIVGSFFTREQAGTDVISTTDLSLRMPRAALPPRLVARGRLVRRGRTAVTTAVTLHAADPLGAADRVGEGIDGLGRVDDAVWAYGETSFARLTRAPGATITAADLALPEVFASHPLTKTLDDEVGVTVVDARRGEVELVLRRAVLNREGTLQGALVALLVERAGEVLGESRLGEPQRVTELDLRYLSTAKVGPVRSRAELIGDPADGMLRVELRDCGRDDRITATAFLRIAPAR